MAGPLPLDALSPSEAALALLKRAEGMRLRWYPDPATRDPTLGYGHLLTEEEKSTGFVWIEGKPVRWSAGLISEEQAEALLRQDANRAADAVRRLIRVPLTQGQFDALVCFTFNAGAGALRLSTLRRKLNHGSYDAVPAELRRWDKATVRTADGSRVKRPLKALTRRRAAEVALWNDVPDAWALA